LICCGNLLHLADILLAPYSFSDNGSGELLRVIFTTFQVSGLALGISTFIGVPFGAFIALSQIRARRLITVLLYTGMGFPPVVVGLAVYLVLSRSGPLGEFEWLFTPLAMITAQTIIAFPLVAGLTVAALEGVDPELRLRAISLGSSRVQEAIIVMQEAKGGLVAAIVAGFGGIISEVGAAMLVGGNIQSSTRVLSTAIVLETRQGAFGFALALGGVLLSLSFLINVIFVMLQGQRRWYRR
jgi:tungstate transport system permease protein